MGIDQDDPRLTAYALGEMDAPERAAFEKELDADPQARGLVADIMLVVERIDDGWQRDQDLELTNEQRAAVFEHRPSAFARWAPLVAALVILAVSIQLYAGSRSAVSRERETAHEYEEYKTIMEAERDAFMSSERAAFLRELEAQRRAALSINEKSNAEVSNEELRGQLASAEVANGKCLATIERQGNQIKTLLEINRTYKKLAKEIVHSNADDRSFKTRWQNEVRRRVGVEGQLMRAREEIDALVDQNEDIEKRWRNAEFWLGKYRQHFGDSGGPVVADGVVKSIKENHVLISVGSNDKVRIGDVYQIRRGADHVGQITITTVFRNAAIGVFDTEFKGPGAPPRSGDVAEARGY